MRTKAISACAKQNRIILIDIPILGRLFWMAFQIYVSFLVTAYQSGIEKNEGAKIVLKII